MKLLRLKINNKSGFRSLKRGFEIKFSSDSVNDSSEFNPYLFAGRNGSGKSNVLEALAEIFFHLDGIYLSYKPKYFEKDFDPEKSRINAYELEYTIRLDTSVFPKADKNKLALINIEKKSGHRPFVKISNYKEFGDNYNQLSAKQIKSLLPEYVVGYASGQNETLSIPFFKSRLLQFDRYYHSLESQEFSDPSPESSLVLMDEEMGQALILTCLLMFDDPDSSEKSEILQPFRDYVEINDIDSFRLILRTDYKIKEPEDTKLGIRGLDDKDDTIYLIQNLDLSDEGKIESSSTRSYIEKLKKCSTFWHEEPHELIDDLSNFKSRSYYKFDFKVDDSTKRAFQLHFENNPLKLFEFLQLSIILNNYVLSEDNKKRAYHSNNPFIQYDIAQKPLEEDRIFRFKNLLVSKKGLSKSIFTKSLSDGEYQFLITLASCLLFSKTNSLFLLDEPETHFNPDWKSKYISSIKNSLKASKNIDDKINSNFLNDILITTHSPFLITDAKSESVFVFREGKVNNPNIKTFGTSVNKITEEIFEKKESISNLSLELIEKIKNYNFEDLEDIQKAKEEARVLGESVEKILLFRELLLKEDKLKETND